MRTMGMTNDCNGCRYWSEMLAFCEGGGAVQAMCLCKDSKNYNKYTIGRSFCPEWKSGYLGAIDDPSEPGDETWRLYEQEDKALAGAEETEKEEGGK